MSAVTRLLALLVRQSGQGTSLRKFATCDDLRECTMPYVCGIGTATTLKF
jgi:hypothetical protein